MNTNETQSRMPGPNLEPAVLHMHPLAYLLGLQGVALFRSFNGEYDRAYAEARMAEIRSLLDAADEIGVGIDVPVIETSEAYDGWAPYYDQPGNAMLEREQVMVRAILDTLPVGVALDAACGTGRHGAYLAGLGHRIIGVDISPGMLAVARMKLPDAEFHHADWHALPIPDNHVDTVVSGLALAHVRDLGPVFAEFARVLKPGGHLVVSDSRGLMDGALLYPMVLKDHDGNPGFMRAWTHRTSDYLRAAIPLGLQVRGCEEYVSHCDLVDGTGTVVGDEQTQPRWTAKDEPADIWALHPWAPTAANANFRDKPLTIVWRFQLDG